jgi:hypothetical protein
MEQKWEYEFWCRGLVNWCKCKKYVRRDDEDFTCNGDVKEIVERWHMEHLRKTSIDEGDSKHRGWENNGLYV